MNILLLGSGGREHALAWKLSQSEICTKLYIAPGNAGTEACGENMDLDPNDFKEIETFCITNLIDMIVVGPEDPLVNGIYDYFQDHLQLPQIKVVGPSKSAARLEGSKDFAKQFMQRHKIPTAGYKSFNGDSLQDGLQYLETQQAPYVLKADGLAAGKGVLICQTLEEAKAELTSMINDAKFGDASKTVVIEEFLTGIEFSVFVLTDGIDYKILPNAKDYKRVGEGDTGLNTGGMGAISPVPFLDEGLMQQVDKEIIEPTITGFLLDEITYEGFLYFGLIKVGNKPYVIEYNCRLGDPETEVVIPRIKNDLVQLLDDLQEGKLKNHSIEIDNRAAAAVILASGGYPESYEKGKVITGLDNVKESIVFHAGTKEQNGNIITSGGRVMAVTSYGKDIKEALATSYMNAKRIEFDNKYFRKDIGFDVL